MRWWRMLTGRALAEEAAAQRRAADRLDRLLREVLPREGGR